MFLSVVQSKRAEDVYVPAIGRDAYFAPRSFPKRKKQVARQAYPALNLTAGSNTQSDEDMFLNLQLTEPVFTAGK